MPFLVPNELRVTEDSAAEEVGQASLPSPAVDEAASDSDFDFELTEDGKLPRPNLDPDSVRAN